RGAAVDRGGRLGHLRSERLGLAQALLDVAHGYVEARVLHIVAGSEDPARDPALGAGVNHAVAHRVGGVDLPAEQVAVELRQGLKVTSGDLKPHHGCTHVGSSCLRRSAPRCPGPTTASCRDLANVTSVSDLEAGLTEMIGDAAGDLVKVPGWRGLVREPGA